MDLILKNLESKMRVLFFLIFIGGHFLFGYDFSYCLKHYQMRALKFKDGYATPVLYNGKTYFIYYSKTPILDRAIAKSDPFIGLYLINPKKEVKGYVLRDVDFMAKEYNVALLRFSGFVQTKIISEQRGFLKYGRLDSKTSSNQVVGNICYQIYGITTENGLLTKRYIDRFLSQDKPYYADIGVRLREDTAIIDIIDPFFEENPFLPGDEIVSINNVPITSENIEWEIANLPEKSLARIEVLRSFKNLEKDPKKLEFTIMVRRAYGGLLLQDSFFESQGIKIDNKLNIKKVHHPQVDGLDQLRRGDQILQINKIDVLKMKGDVFENLKHVLSDALLQKGYIEMLISRDGFQFNIKIQPKNHFNDERLEALKPKAPKKKKEGFILMKEGRKLDY